MSATTKPLRGPVIALSHGGGPMPLLGDPGSANITASLRSRVPEILRLDDPEPARRPEAIVLVTAHWSTERPTISSGSRHALLFDYYGFPPETYRYEYEAPGAPELAEELAALYREEAAASGALALADPVLDAERGWDHGVFVPLLLARPQADIPVLQVSVLQSEDPAAHLAMGRALGKLRTRRNVAIVGSGFASFHNLRLAFSGLTEDPGFKRRNREWSEAVTKAAVAGTGEERADLFTSWRAWPNAYENHPRGAAEHFMPLIVCAGAAGGGDGEVAGKWYKDQSNGLDIYSYYWD